MGPGGSGKSTLLNLIGGLDQTTSGEIFMDGKPLHGITDDELTLIRRRRVGFIFQFFNLLPILTAVENVCLPLLLEGTSFSRVSSKAVHLLEQMGLGERIEHRPEQLSGGDMQRVAIARALITDPAVLLADEPTSATSTPIPVKRYSCSFQNSTKRAKQGRRSSRSFMWHAGYPARSSIQWA